MSNDTAPSPTAAGPAIRVTLMGAQHAEAYEGVYARLDAQYGVVHVFSSDRQVHYLTIPLGSALIEWQDPAMLQPRLRLPVFGPGAFQRMGEQMQQMFEEIEPRFSEDLDNHRRAYQPCDRLQSNPRGWTLSAGLSFASKCSCPLLHCPG